MDKTQNIFTVDVEEYYHAENISRSISAGKLQGLPDRVGIGVNKILDLLARHGSRATFFVLGCVAEKHTSLIKSIVAAGHEIASHGYEHTPLTRHTPRSFEKDLGESVKLLEDLSGAKVLGYRATSFSLTGEFSWFFDTLRKFGLRYDSSIALSLFRPHGAARSPKSCPYEIAPGILEFPISTLSLGPIRLPVGGGYFRAYPLWMTSSAAAQEARQGSPFVFYMHPWEIDHEQPKLPLPWEKAMRHYSGLDCTEKKLSAMFASRRFGRICDFLHEVNPRKGAS